MWKKFSGVRQTTHIPRQVPKITNTHTHTQYVTLITFLLQQWWHESVSMLHC
jgi:hypothetical protein